MPKGMQIALAVVTLFLLGVVTSQLLEGRAEAQQRAWRECFLASMWDNDGAQMARPGFRARTVAVPPGWTPVGGAGRGDRVGGVILCR